MQPIQTPKVDRDLRAELDAAIQIQRAADARAERATGIAAIADRLMREAGEEVARLQAAQKEAEKLPALHLPAPADAAPLAAAIVSFNALEIAAAKLNAERDAARPGPGTRART